MKNMHKVEKPERKFLLQINENIWKRFVLTLPENTSANEKIEKLITDYLIEYEKAMRDTEAEKKTKDFYSSLSKKEKDNFLVLVEKLMKTIDYYEERLLENSNIDLETKFLIVQYMPIMKGILIAKMINTDNKKLKEYLKSTKNEEIRT